jgi:hypothetical protein
VSAKSTDLEPTVSTEGRESSVRFPALSPDFASAYDDAHARWMNVLKFRSYGTEETFALTLPSSFTGKRTSLLPLGGLTIVSREGASISVTPPGNIALLGLLACQITQAAPMPLSWPFIFSREIWEWELEIPSY